MELELLQKIGLNKSEVKVYLTLLDLGSSTTGPIMDKAKISSSKIYGILNRLIEKGLVSFIIKDKTKYYQASSPRTLLDYMEEKESELDLQKKQIKVLIPELKLREELAKYKQEARVYLGWKGIMSAFNFILDNLKTGDDYFGFAQTELEEGSKEVKIFFSQYQRKRQEKRLNVHLIAQKSQRKVFRKEPYTKFRNFKVKYLDIYPPGVVIGKENVLISTFLMSPVAVVISSRQIATAYRNYFIDLWKIAKK